MVVTCPKCKTRLKVNETKLSPRGSRVKCPRCSSVLLVKKPSMQIRKALDSNKILVAHSNPATIEKISSMLTGQGYTVIAASNGIDAIVKASKEYPFLSIVEVTLPKIYGFEVCKRLKTRPETKEIKFLLITSVYDKTKYKREPASLYGADDYVEEHNVTTELIEKINRICKLPEEEPEKITEPPLRKLGLQQPEIGDKPEQKVETTGKEEIVSPERSAFDEKIERARRLSRTIINDIHLYNSKKVEESIRNNNFHSVFASELKEGQKLYESRIHPEIRDKGNFFTEAIENFIAGKKKRLNN